MTVVYADFPSRLKVTVLLLLLLLLL